MRRLAVPGITTVFMLLILLGLGTWQMRRLAWKQGILAQIAAAERASAVPLPPAPPAFAKVSVAGRLRPDLAALYGAEVRDRPSGPVLGGQMLVPLERAGAPPLLVDLGWVAARSGEALPKLPMTGVTIDGYVRPAEHPGPFSASDDPRARAFYTLDPQKIGAALGLPSVAPFTLVALGDSAPPGWPDPARHLPRPPNNHLQYAIIWYGLAAVLPVIFALHARKVLRP